MSYAITLDEIEQVCADLTAAGVRTTADVEEIQTPGAWLRHTGFSLDHLDAFTHRTELHLVVPNNGYLKARDELVRLFNLVLPIIKPDGDPYFQGLAIDGAAPVPGLVVPLDLTSPYLHTEE